MWQWTTKAKSVNTIKSLKSELSQTSWGYLNHMTGLRTQDILIKKKKKRKKTSSSNCPALWLPGQQASISSHPPNILCVVFTIMGWFISEGKQWKSLIVSGLLLWSLSSVRPCVSFVYKISTLELCTAFPSNPFWIMLPVFPKVSTQQSCTALKNLWQC